MEAADCALCLGETEIEKLVMPLWVCADAPLIDASAPNAREFVDLWW